MLQITIDDKNIIVSKLEKDITISEFNALHALFVMIIEKNQEIQNHYLDNKLYETY